MILFRTIPNVKQKLIALRGLVDKCPHPAYVLLHLFNFSVKEEADTSDLEYIDLIFIVLNNIFEQAKKDGLKLNEHILANLDHYRHDQTLIENLKIEKAQLEAEAKGGVWGFLSMHVMGIFSIGGESKIIVREFVKPRLSQLLKMVNDLILDVTQKYRKKGKTPILIVEDLDKLDLAVA